MLVIKILIRILSLLTIHSLQIQFNQFLPNTRDWVSTSGSISETNFTHKCPYMFVSKCLDKVVDVYRL